MFSDLSNLTDLIQNSSNSETIFESPQNHQQEIQSSFNNNIKQNSKQKSPRSSQNKQTGFDYNKSIINLTPIIKETQLLYQDSQNMKQYISFNNDNIKNKSIFQNPQKQEQNQNQQQQQQLQITLEEHQQFQQILQEEQELVKPIFIKRQSNSHIITNSDELQVINTPQNIDHQEIYKTPIDNNFLNQTQNYQNVEQITQNFEKKEVNSEKYLEQNIQSQFKQSTSLEKDKIDLEHNLKVNSFQKQISNQQNLEDLNQYDIFELIGNNTIDPQQGNAKSNTEAYQLLNNSHQNPQQDVVVDNSEQYNRFCQQNVNKIQESLLTSPEQQINSRKDLLTQEIPTMTEKQFSAGLRIVQRPSSLQLEPTYFMQSQSNNNNSNYQIQSDQPHQKKITNLHCSCPVKFENNQTNPSNCCCNQNLNQSKILNNEIFQQNQQNKQIQKKSQFNKFDNSQIQRIQNKNNNFIYLKEKQQKNLNQNTMDKFKLNEQQINMVNYAFLNQKDGLQRMHIRTQNQEEYSKIMNITNLMIKTLTLHHDGHQFKSNGNQKQIFGTKIDESSMQLPQQYSDQYNKENNQYDYQQQHNNMIDQKHSQYHSHQGTQQSIHQKQYYQDCKQNNFNNQEQNISQITQNQDQKFQQLHLNIKGRDQILVSPNVSEKEISNHINFKHLGYEQNQPKQKSFQDHHVNFNNYPQSHSHINDDLHDDDHQQERHIMRHEEESFEKSSNNLTSEQWQCIQQLQKHKKKNVAKNIMTAFKNFISNPMKFGYTQQQIGTALSCYNKSKKIEESFDEMQNKFMKYIVKKKFNHYTIKLLIQHPNYGQVFEYFLKQLADFWLEQSKVHDIEAHLAMIKFLKEAYNDIEIINQLKKYDKRKY